MQKKYELTTDIVVHFGRKLFRIKALVSFGNISAGDNGGYIEKEENLSQFGNAWVYGNARVFGDARVSITPICVTGLGYNVTITDDHICIGCEFHSITDWASFDDRRILEMDGKNALTFWRKHGHYILSLREVTNA